MCTFEDSSDTQIRPSVCVSVRPLRLEEERTVLLGLYSNQQGGTVEVVARPNIENDHLFLHTRLCVESDAAVTCLRALLVGRTLTFSLSVPPDLKSWSLTQEPVGPLLTVDLPNGPSFNSHCNKIINQIKRSHMPHNPLPKCSVGNGPDVPWAAGMDLNQIEAQLKKESVNARSVGKRLAQINFEFLAATMPQGRIIISV